MTIKDLLNLYTEYSKTQTYDDGLSDLHQPIAYIMSLGGKHIRPLMCLTAYHAYQDEVTPCLPLSHGIEMFHNFTLMHDDIMDEANLRRGKPAAHIRFGTNAAILSGDALLIKAYDYILRASKSVKIDLITSFNQTAYEICVGQQMDIEFESQNSVSTEKYLQMIRLKTAVLLGESLQAGAKLAGGNEQDAQVLKEWGDTLGLAFQIQDDYLDFYGDQATIGKIQGGDIIQNKKTILVSTALELANSDQRSSLLKLLDSNEMSNTLKLENLSQIFLELNIPELIKSKVASYFKNADLLLDNLSLSDEKKHPFRLLAASIESRSY